jgi:uncharacterized protein YecA (UPF0149 family)
MDNLGSVPDNIVQTLQNLASGLSETQLLKLTELTKNISDPSKIDPVEAMKILKSIGIDPKKLKKMVKGNSSSEQPKKAWTPGRNGLCPCGSQKKYKKCCLK